MKKAIGFLVSTAFYGIFFYWVMKNYGNEVTARMFSDEIETAVKYVLLFGPGIFWAIFIFVFCRTQDDDLFSAFGGSFVMSFMISGVCLFAIGFLYSTEIISQSFSSILYYVYLVVLWILFVIYFAANLEDMNESNREYREYIESIGGGSIESYSEAEDYYDGMSRDEWLNRNV